MPKSDNKVLDYTVEQMLPFSHDEIIMDYRLMYKSRQASLIGRREVLSGKAKFGIFGDGKELPQIAMSKSFQKGDIRSGYYRDQTWAMATGLTTIKQFFAQLYATPDLELEPFSGGRQMNSHFASRNLNPDGSWKRLVDLINTSADASPTGSQMPRMVGLAQASKFYRERADLQHMDGFSNKGNEVVFGTIGNASCAEGLFWETINAVGVLQVPLVMSIWDDGYGISVPNEYQVTKSNISEILKGFQRDEKGAGYEIFVVKAWDYLALCETYKKATELAREHHIPSLIHVIEVTQPQGHSTSGSHERYKSKERLQWERDYDCLVKMRQWIIEQGIATDDELAVWEKADRKAIRTEKNAAWKEFQQPILSHIVEVNQLINEMAKTAARADELTTLITKLKKNQAPLRTDVMEVVHKALVITHRDANVSNEALKEWKRKADKKYAQIFNTYLYSESVESALKVEEVAAIYSDDSPTLSGFEVLNRCFDIILANKPEVLAFGEDVGHLGDVNQGFAGLQAKYGKHRVSDTGIREATIAGQAIGLALRGLRPIAEIQYLDYFIYAIQTLSDDLATTLYRTAGGQKAPAIIRTRGHRLEGIWHSGSPMGMIINALRGVLVLVPRNMTQAAGFYNTVLQSDEPAVIVEVLNGYRLKEKLPDNLAEYTVPVGVPEVIRQGSDVTIVTYGACCRVAMDAAAQLAQHQVDVEVIDVRSLLPFDRKHMIVESLKKTNRIVFLDEDVPGGASAFMMRHVLEIQGGYFHLDSKPITITAHPHRPAYASDGDYFSKPQVEHVFQAIYDMMNEFNPDKYPTFF